MLEAKSSTIASLVDLADAYCISSGRSRASLAKEIFDRGSQIDDLALGKRDLTTRSAEAALNWFAANWPTDADWPADIDRPSPQDADGVPTAGPDGRTSGPALPEAAE